MKVCDVMSQPVLSVTENASVEAVMSLFCEHHISGVPVLSDQGDLAGVISKSDLYHPDIMKKIEAGIPLFQISINTLKTFEGALTIESDETVEDAALKMSQHHVHRLVVTNAIGNIIGMISTFDITKVKSHENPIDYEHPDLTAFDIQLIRLLFLKKSDKEIAGTLYLSDAELYQKVGKIQTKLGVNNKDQIVKRAYELNLL
jgi:CBS domain-containing protein